jgi:apolipoprotein N-acyltransferase
MRQEGCAHDGATVSDRGYGVQFRSVGPLAPLRYGAMWFAGITGFPRYVTAFLLGALATAALPPVDMVPVLILSFSGLVWLADGSSNGRSAFALGWCFGFGFFVAGLYWIAASLFVDIAAFWWMVPFAVAGLPAYLALYTGLALWASFAACRRWRLTGSARILTLAVAWAATEWLRGHALTGFPWNLLGYAWSGGFPGALAVLQVTSIVGIYGLSLLTVLIAALPARLGDFGDRKAGAVVAAFLLLAVPAAAGAWRLVDGPRRDVAGVTLRLVQPSIPQRFKNDRNALAANFQRLLALSAAPGADRVSAIIWPEAAAPPFLERYPEERGAMAAVLPPNGLLITGAVRGAPLAGPLADVWNSVDVIDRSGAVVATYDKFRLVPFGEYVPFRSVLPVDKVVPQMGDFSRGPGPRTIALPGLPPVDTPDCYEVIFPGEITDPADRPGWLLNLSNTAWFGDTSGPYQHAAMSRVRAVEEGLPLVRVANNGISAVFDPYGRVVALLDLDEVAIRDAPLPTALPPTLYSRWKDGPFLVLLTGLLVIAAFLARMQGKTPPTPWH